MSVTLLTIFSAIGGYLLGQLPEWIRGFTALRATRLQILNETLFTLLEARHFARSLAAAHDENLPKLFVQRIKKKAPNEEIPEAEIAAMIRSCLKQMMFAMVHKMSEDLSEYYATVVRRLAQIEPVLAFQISNSNSLTTFLEEVKKSHDQIVAGMKQGNAPEQELHLAATVLDDARGVFTKDFADSMDGTISRIAKRCTLWFWITENVRRIQAARSHQKARHDPDMVDFIDSFLDRIIEHDRHKGQLPSANSGPSPS